MERRSQPPPEHEPVVAALAARLADPSDPGAAEALARLLGAIAELPAERGYRDLAVDEASARAELPRRALVRAMKALELAGCGRFQTGRRGHASRFAPRGSNLVAVARRTLAAAAGAPRPAPEVELVRHAFRLRPGVTLELGLPADLSRAEAQRLATFVRALPVEAPAPRRPEPVRTPRNRVAVGLSLLCISRPVMIAAREGLFRAEGLDVDLRTFETAQPLMDAIAEGALAAGGFVAFPISMAAELEGAALRHVGVLVEDAAHPVSRLLIRAGARVRRLEDLAGRPVGVLPTLAYRRWLTVLLRQHGVGAVELVDAPGARALELLESRAIDALFTNDPAATAALVARAGRLPRPEPRVPELVLEPMPFGSFVLSAALVEERPDLARALARALDGAIEIGRRSPVRVRQALAAFLPGQGRLAGLFPPARFAKTATLSASTLGALGARYHELAILPRPVLPQPFRATELGAGGPPVAAHSVRST